MNGPCYGEEHEHSAGSSAWMWVIDPIDGTASFVLGHLHWATLIGLNDGTRPVLGVAYQPFVGEFFLGLSAGAALSHTYQYRGIGYPRYFRARIRKMSSGGAL